MIFKPQPTAQYPSMIVSEDGDIQVSGKQVTFSLYQTDADSWLKLQMILAEDSRYYIHSPSHDPQDSVGEYYPAWRLLPHQTATVVEFDAMAAITGMQIALTFEQMHDLQEELDELAERRYLAQIENFSHEFEDY